MGKKMLIDAAHPEETRVVVVSGNRIEEFDYEAASKRQLKGNIYLAKITRVEPSLQAAFVDYGGNRHGFLAFSEIHPDYYQIPVEDREALLAAEAAEERRSDASEDAEMDPEAAPADDVDEAMGDVEGSVESIEEDEKVEEIGGVSEEIDITSGEEDDDAEETGTEGDASDDDEDDVSEETLSVAEEISEDDSEDEEEGTLIVAATSEDSHVWGNTSKRSKEFRAEMKARREQRRSRRQPKGRRGRGGRSDENAAETDNRRHRFSRRYKIQEVIKRRQVLLIQVVKEERGNKGATLTTYLSLAGRYSVLMPNTNRGGGISRKITNLADRKRLKGVVEGLEVPEGMGLIVRTAGADRTKADIKRDYEYLLRLWENVRDLTLRSSAPSVVYEEGNLIKRSIRDLYSREIESVQVEGEAGYKEAKAFMKMLIPSHAKKVQAYKDRMPLFQRHQVEASLDAMFNPEVQLKSGGYIVINPTEALVSIDVNSGKSTREHSIEDTALKTNLEAAAEVARQLRLRDLAGLVVIDFIDMEDYRNNRAVERKLKEALKDDRARIQVGRISSFGLLEMSRQRLRAGLHEGTTITCPHCDGVGLIKSTEGAALTFLRAVEEEAIRGRAASCILRVPGDSALYLLNNKRRELSDIERRYDFNIDVQIDPEMLGNNFELQRGEPRRANVQDEQVDVVSVDTGFDDEETSTQEETEGSKDADDRNGNGRRRRRRRGKKSERDAASEDTIETVEEADAASEASKDGQSGDTEAAEEEDKPRRRRRGRRGGRRRRKDADSSAAEEGETPDIEQEASTPSEEKSEVEAAEEAPEEKTEKPARRRKRTSTKSKSKKEKEEVESPVAQAVQDLASELDVPVGETGAANDDAEPVPAEEEPPAKAAPKRSGWWSRRKSS